jgi:pimeloyl-ACP methyl ester carboxylesterase
MREPQRFRLRALLLGTVAVAMGSPAWAQGTSGDPVYDAELRAYPYPYEVFRYQFELQGAPCSMAYMDVRPPRPNGRAVVLLHGKNFASDYWERTIRALTAKGYRVVAPDQIGFGKSSKPEHFQFSLHALASQTAALLDRLSLPRVSLVGHSMGGMLAIRFALLYPGRVERLVLVNPIGLEDWSRVVPYQSIDARFAGELQSTPERVRAYMRDNYFAGEWKPEYDALLRIPAGWLRGPDRRRIAWVSALTSDMVFTQPVVHELAELRVPTLLIIGQRDRTAPGRERARPALGAELGNYPELGRRAHALIAGSTLVEVPGVGHLPQVEAFDRYLTALEGYLGSP